MSLERLAHALTEGTPTTAEAMAAFSAIPQDVWGGLLSITKPDFAHTHKQLDINAYPRRLRPFVVEANKQIDALSLQIEASEITPTQWAKDMAQILREFYTAAFMAGFGDDSVPDEAKTRLEQLVQVQLDYLAVFRSEIVKDGWKPAYNSRARMYGSSIAQAYWNGDTVRQAGRVLPLPRMPAEGTICGSNCKCKWEIKTLKGEGNYNCFWRLQSQNECQTCLERSRQWNPLRIRNNEVMTT